MHPNFSFQIFSFSIDISAYSMFFWVALLVFIVGSYFFAAIQMELDAKKVFWCLLIMIASGIVGARILNAFLNLDFYLANPQRFWSFKLQGFSIFGSSLAVFFGWIYCKFVKLDIWKMADSLTPFLGMGIALMRVGCFLNGCCYGVETKLPWGVVFPDLGRAHIHQISQNPFVLLSGPSAVHPTQIYELIAALIGSIVAFWLIKKKVAPGLSFLIFAVWFSIFRLFNNFLRVPPQTFDASQLFYPFFYLFFIFFGLFFIFLRIKKSDSRNS